MITDGSSAGHVDLSADRRRRIPEPERVLVADGDGRVAAGAQDRQCGAGNGAAVEPGHHRRRGRHRGGTRGRQARQDAGRGVWFDRKHARVRGSRAPVVAYHRLGQRPRMVRLQPDAGSHPDGHFRPRPS